ncbi:MAG: response regulator [Sandaracinus sp.]
MSGPEDKSPPGARAPDPKKQLGKILLKQKLVTPRELEGLLEDQKKVPGQRLASAVAQSGRVGDVELLRALSEQHGVSGIDLAQVVVPLANLKLVPLEVARQYLILPFSVKDEEIHLAMADPQDQRVVQEIEFVTGRTVTPYVALHDHLARVIDEAYQQADRGEAYYVGPAAPPDYLASLGIAPSRPPPPPAPKPPPPPNRPKPPPPPKAAAPADAETDFSDLFADEDAPAKAKQDDARPPPSSISALDAAFDSRVAPLPRDEQTQKRGRTGPPKILVVDDEDDIRRMLRRVLVERGYQVVEASRGTEALQAVREHAPDLILLDAMLPEIHGFDICRRIKGSQKYGHIPIIMVSAVYRGWRFAEDLRQSFGVAAFLEKPFKITDVLAATERALEGQPPPEEAPDADETISEQAGEALASGIDAYKRGDVDDAIAHLLRGVGIDPLSFRLHYHLGLLYGRRDQVFEAIHALETAVDLAPKNFAALKNLAVLYQRAGFKHKAIEIWERALGSAPDDETRRGIKEHLMSLL